MDKYILEICYYENSFDYRKFALTKISLILGE